MENKVKKTKKGNAYIETFDRSMTEGNKKLADEGKSIFEQYAIFPEDFENIDGRFDD